MVAIPRAECYHWCGGDDVAKTSSAVKRRYNQKAYDNIQISVPKGRKAELQLLAEQAGESLTAYIMAAVDARAARERAMDDPKK